MAGKEMARMIKNDKKDLKNPVINGIINYNM